MSPESSPFIFHSEVMKVVRRTVERIEPSNETVLITGETGTCRWQKSTLGTLDRELMSPSQPAVVEHQRSWRQGSGRIVRRIAVRSREQARARAPRSIPSSFRKNST
jgi:hypothetical protein